MLEQADSWWNDNFAPRMIGLSDDEYFWEPVAACWNVRPQPGGGFAPDWAMPAPDPPPVTTIAWRLCHIGSGVLAVRNHDHFDGPAFDVAGTAWPGTAADALAWIDDGFHRWSAGVRGLSDERLAAPVGPTAGRWGHLPMAGLVLHIHRELIHHGAEACLLRDLYRARDD